MAESLRYLLEAAGDRLALDADAVARFLESVERAPLCPEVFAIYRDLVPVLGAGDLNRANCLFRALLDQPGPADGLRFATLADPETDPGAERLRRIVDSDPSVSFPIHPPTPAEADAARERVERGLALLDAADPDAAAEVRTLLREIVLAVGPPDAGEVFDGASALLLWGGIVLNARSHETPLQAAQALVHETTHNLLFGLSADDPLVLNADERHASPLRNDPRPLEGIYHATFVLARVHRTTARLLESGRLEAEDRRTAQRDLQAFAQRFAEGLATLDIHAELTPFGREVLEGARAFMASRA